MARRDLKSNGDRGQIRTVDPIIKSDVLYRLSYAVITSGYAFCFRHIMDLKPRRQAFLKPFCQHFKGLKHIHAHTPVI